MDGAATGRVNYSSPYAGGPSASQRIAETATMPLDGCTPALCSRTTWHDVSELFQAGRLLQVRVILNWTNDQANSATMAIAANVPYHMGETFFHDGAFLGGNMQAGTFSQTVVFESGAAEWWEGDYEVGVLVRSYAIATGVPYTLDVTVAPVERGAGMFQFYEFALPEGAAVSAELVRPLADEREASVDLLFYDATDRPMRHVAVTGDDGATTAIDLPPGPYVLYVARAAGGYARFHADGASGNLTLVPLAAEWKVAPVVELLLPQGSGQESLTTETATGGVWIWLDPRDVAGAASAFAANEATVTLTSSRGVVRESTLEGEFGATTEAVGGCGGSCISLGVGTFQFHPENYLDDDGTFLVSYEGSGIVGTIMASTQRYVRG